SLHQLCHVRKRQAWLAIRAILLALSFPGYLEGDETDQNRREESKNAFHQNAKRIPPLIHICDPAPEPWLPGHRHRVGLTGGERATPGTRLAGRDREGKRALGGRS